MDDIRIYVDADACPVKGIIENVAREFELPVTMIIDTSHQLYSEYSEILTVSKAPDAVDLALINRCSPGDIIVTQDYGVATLALGKKAYAIHQNGKIYTNENIELMLFERHISGKARRAGKHYKSIPKRTREDDERFEKSFRKLCNLALSK